MTNLYTKTNFKEYVCSIAPKRLFWENGETVLSLVFHTKKVDDDTYRIYDVNWQDEDSCCHCVCNNNSDYIEYSVSENVLHGDLWLTDKYGDCSDGWLSDRLSPFFEELPSFSNDGD